MKTVRSRKWLNPAKDGGTAFVSYTFEPHKSREGCWATLSISDCHRTISLEFGYDGNTEYEERMKKMAILRGEIAALEALMVKLNEAKK